MNIPKSFPAKGWRKVRRGEIIKKGDVWNERSGPRVATVSCGSTMLLNAGLYRKIKPKAKK